MLALGACRRSRANVRLVTPRIPAILKSPACMLRTGPFPFAHLANNLQRPAVDSVWPLIRVGLESNTPRSSSIHSERHRTPRFPFVAGILITDLVTEKQLAAHIEDLSLFGCFVETLDPLPVGAKISLRISYCGASVIAQGAVAYSRDNGGMGIAFTTIEPSSLPILDAWLDDLRRK